MKGMMKMELKRCNYWPSLAGLSTSSGSKFVIVWWTLAGWTIVMAVWPSRWNADEDVDGIGGEMICREVDAIAVDVLGNDKLTDCWCIEVDCAIGGWCDVEGCDLSADTNDDAIAVAAIDDECTCIVGNNGDALISISDVSIRIVSESFCFVWLTGARTLVNLLARGVFSSFACDCSSVAEVIGAFDCGSFSSSSGSSNSSSLMLQISKFISSIFFISRGWSGWGGERQWI